MVGRLNWMSPPLSIPAILHQHVRVLARGSVKLSRCFHQYSKSHLGHSDKRLPPAGLEPATTRLRALRSTD